MDEVSATADEDSATADKTGARAEEASATAHDVSAGAGGAAASGCLPGRVPNGVPGHVPSHVPNRVPTPEGRFLSRPRLFERIDAHRAAGSAIWLAARAGAGKSALVRAYSAARDVPLLPWGPVTPDADVACVLEAFAQACSGSMPDDTSRRPVPPPGMRRQIELFLTRLPRPAILWFDDLHELPSDAFALAAIREAIDAAPAGVTIMVGSRRPPPPGFSRLRVSGRVAVLDDATLCLDAAEAEALLRREGVRSPIEASRMIDLADGWMAGLLLLARASRPVDAVPDLAVDYVTAEVLDKLPPECRLLLDRTALLPLVSGSSAIALTGDPCASRRLQALARDSGFVRRSALLPDTFEVHPLVRAALGVRLAVAVGSSPGVRALHGSAARLLADLGQVDSAVAMSIDAGQWTDVAETLRRHAPDLVAEGRGEVLAGWLRALPPAFAERDPWLTFWLGACVRDADPRGAAVLFERAWHRFAPTGACDGALLACCGVLDAWATDPTGVDAPDRWLDRLVASLSVITASTLPAAMEDLLHAALSVLSRCRPDHALLAPLGERAWRVLEAPGHGVARLAACCFVMRLAMHRGDVRAQTRSHLLGEALASAPDASSRLRMRWHTLEVLHFCTILDFAGARRVVDRLRPMVAGAGPGPWVADLGWCLACVAAGTGDPRLAESAVAAIAGGRCGTDSRDPHRAAVIRTMAALLRGDVEAARTHVEVGFRGLDGLHAPAARVTFLQLAAITFAKCAAHDAAAACLEEAGRIDAVAGLAALTRTGRFAQAFVALLAGDAVRAADALRAGIRLARAQGCPNWGLLLTPAVTARLAGAALAAGIEPAWIREIIRTRGLLPDGPVSEAWPWPIRIHTLGRFTVLCRDVEVRFSGRSQRKPMELLETLLALGGRDVAAARVAGVLWPQSDGDSAANALGTTLHRLRKLIGEDASITLVDGRLTLDPRLVWVDTWAFERAASECESLAAAGAPPASIVKSFEVALNRYRGQFLPANEGGPGVLARRERLHGRFRRVSEAVVEIAVARSDGGRADALCHRILDVDPLAEPINRALMRSLAAQGRHGEALEVCARAERLLMAELGRGLSPATRAVRRAIGDAAGNPDR
jgi:LuxR family transcriptional regulator, maltose regulon positive regulatory protein